MRPRSRYPSRRKAATILDRLEDLAIELADVDSEDDAAYRRARRKLWHAFRAEVEARAQARARAQSVHRRKVAG